MVNIDERVQQIKKMVDRGDYFCINRGRQYGKTTTLCFLKKALDAEYTVFSISFEGDDSDAFSSLKSVVAKMFASFARLAKYSMKAVFSDEARRFVQQDFAAVDSSEKLSELISDFCLLFDKPVVMIIDEVDQAGNYDAFIKFLGLLRDKYLNRMDFPTFHSVILAGVYDIKNLKLKIRPEAEHQYNSPWNIAAQFDVDMDLSECGIKGMLDELVPQNHFVRIVSKTVDELEIEEVFARNTKGGGASRYNPVMLLKVLIYCYMTGTATQRQTKTQLS